MVFLKLSYFAQGTVESRDRKIDYISISSSPLVAYLDDQILSKLVRLFGAGNVRHHGHVSVLDELAQEARTLAKSSLRVRRVVLKSVLIDFDVHLSKSPWLPIAIDVSRCVLYLHGDLICLYQFSPSLTPLFSNFSEQTLASRT